jgi:hypothetical protein
MIACNIRKLTADIDQKGIFPFFTSTTSPIYQESRIIIIQIKIGLIHTGTLLCDNLLQM